VVATLMFKIIMAGGGEYCLSVQRRLKRYAL